MVDFYNTCNIIYDCKGSLFKMCFGIFTHFHISKVPVVSLFECLSFKVGSKYNTQPNLCYSS